MGNIKAISNNKQIFPKFLIHNTPSSLSAIFFRDKPHIIIGYSHQNYQCWKLYSTSTLRT